MRLPKILTLAWWKWAFAHGHRLGFLRLEHYYRTRIRTTIRNGLHRPICWVVGHRPYKDAYWNYAYMKCGRCRALLEVLWESDSLKRLQGDRKRSHQC
jgi:hypothetical protein